MPRVIRDPGKPVKTTDCLVGQISRRDIIRLLATLEQLNETPRTDEEPPRPDQSRATLNGPRFLEIQRQSGQRLAEC